VLSGDLKLDKGIFTAVLGDGSHVTLRVTDRTGRLQVEEGTRIVQYLSGPANESDYTGFAFLSPAGEARLWRRFADSARLLEALRVVLGDPQAGAEAYALESGHCARCGRLLTVPASLHRGLGPECARHWGVAAATPAPADDDDPEGDAYVNEDAETERAIEARNDAWASWQTEIDARHGM